jgi:hypothetical protein
LPPDAPPDREARSGSPPAAESSRGLGEQGRRRRGAEGGRAPPCAVVELCPAASPRELPLLLHRLPGHRSCPPPLGSRALPYKSRVLQLAAQFRGLRSASS